MNRGFCVQGQVSHLPDNTKDAFIWKGGTTVHMTGCRYRTAPQNMQIATSFDDFLSEKMEHAWLFHHMNRDMPFFDLS
jgi:hypothetical protein